VCRELTKTHEEIKRGSLAELAAWAAEVSGTDPREPKARGKKDKTASSGAVRGEITLVVAGAARRRAADRTDPGPVGHPGPVPGP
jgi:16S rRNA (cytidine1402-2'-O)-methyltransferase